jgi:hypothetical protein
MSMRNPKRKQQEAEKKAEKETEEEVQFVASARLSAASPGGLSVGKVGERGRKNRRALPI